MLVRRTFRESQMVDLLDRILDKGMVIDVWARVMMAGIDVGIAWEANMVVASIDTYLERAGPIDLLDSVARPQQPVLKEKLRTTSERLTNKAGAESGLPRRAASA